ncbi:hypothetical protein [Streptomyces sp. NPDC058735]|uniref:hypothetical protein n=1 Tax=unclassified Streptomyces TaxID=2593676 RepID=UPI0036BAF088
MTDFGPASAVFAPRFSRAGAAGPKELFGTTGGKPTQIRNRRVFVVVGPTLAVFGLLRTVGVAG